MENNIITSISKKYASALFDSSDNKRETFEQLKSVCETIKSSSDLNNIISNPSVQMSKKIEILESILKEKIDSKVLNFIKILTEKSRISELGSIIEEYKNQLNKSENKKEVEIISATEIQDSLKQEIIKRLQSKFESDIIPVWNIDKDLIAGLEFRYDGNIIDTSVRAKLKDLGKKLLR